jgi:hypothetical protein
MATHAIRSRAHVGSPRAHALCAAPNANRRLAVVIRARPHVGCRGTPLASLSAPMVRPAPRVICRFTRVARIGAHVVWTPAAMRSPRPQMTVRDLTRPRRARTSDR